MSATLLASAALLVMPGSVAIDPPAVTISRAGLHEGRGLGAVSEPGAASEIVETVQIPEGSPSDMPLPAMAQVSLPVTDQQAPPPPPLDQIEQDGPAIIVSGARRPREDPMQAVNQASYEAVQAVDDAVIAPVAMTYEKVLPRPIRSGLRNFLRNLTEPIVAINFLLQLKPGKAGETLGRFAINSTVGVAGLVDVAAKKPFNLPYRRNGFAYTMGYHGIGPGPYMFLPLVGPTTLRDVVGLTLDRFLLPFAVGGPLRHPGYVYGGFVVRSLDERVENDALFARIREESNPYASYRELYLKTRQAEIDALKGKAAFQQEGSVVLPALTPTPPPVMAEPVLAAEPAAPPAPVFVSEPVVQPLPSAR